MGRNSTTSDSSDSDQDSEEKTDVSSIMKEPETQGGSTSTSTSQPGVTEESVPAQTSPDRKSSAEDVAPSKTPRQTGAAPEGFTVERTEAGRIKGLWIQLKDQKKTFKSFKAANSWVAENPNYLDSVEEQAEVPGNSPGTLNAEADKGSEKVEEV